MQGAPAKLVDTENITLDCPFLKAKTGILFALINI